MEPLPSELAVLPVLWPLASAFCLAALNTLLGRWTGWAAAAAAGMQLGMSCLILRTVTVTGRTLVHHAGGWAPPLGISVEVDLLGAWWLVLLSSVAFLILAYAAGSPGYDLPAPTDRWFRLLALILLGSMSGLVLTRDLFNLYVMIEISSIASYGVVSVRDHPAALGASLKYVVLGAMGSGTILLAIALVYATTGYLDLGYAGEAMRAAMVAHPRATLAPLALFLVGLGLKSGLMPLHAWLPDAHSAAATPASAILSGLVVKANALAFFRVAYGLWGAELFQGTPLPPAVEAMAMLSMLGGAVLAWGQRDLKRMLAYSTAGHMGYVFLGLALGNQDALAGSLMHVANHAVLKTCLFLAAGLLIRRAGTRQVAGLAGIGRVMPWTTAVFSLAALGMVGVPGTNGFVSKWYIALGSLGLGRAAPALAVLLSSLINGVFYLPLVVSAYLHPGPARAGGREGSRAQVLVLGALAAMIVGLGLWPRGLLHLCLSAARSLLNLP